MPTQLTVREIQLPDIQHLADYWFNATPEHLIGMGADPAKLPPREGLTKMLTQQIAAPFQEKQTYALIWVQDEQAIGHCNINQITFGDQAHMHLHLWQSTNRQKGVGSQLVRASLPYFFENFALKRLICEPYAQNPAPNKTLKKLGFAFEKTYRTIPGALNFEQEVNRWVLTREKYLEMP